MMVLGGILWNLVELHTEQCTHCKFTYMLQLGIMVGTMVSLISYIAVSHLVCHPLPKVTQMAAMDFLLNIET